LGKLMQTLLFQIKYLYSMCTTLSCTKYRKQPQVLLDTSKQWTPVVQKPFEAKEVLILKLAAPPPPQR